MSDSRRSTLANRLALAACTLVAPALPSAAPAAAPDVAPTSAGASAADAGATSAPGAPAAALPVIGSRADWNVDTSWLSYIESDDRVAVSKSIGTLTRATEGGSLGITLVHDTMSGASPTGAVRSDDPAVTYTGASGGAGFAAGGGGGDGTMGQFEDTRLQAGLQREQALRRSLTLSYGGVVSQESDYDSIGASVGIEKERADRMSTLDAGLALTSDTIYRSGGEDTPEPLAVTSEARRFEKGERRTVETRLGISRVLNRRTLAQLSTTVAMSDGYHSDPYKVLSAVDDTGRVVANLHDSRPDSRLRTSVQGQLVHQLAGSTHALRLGYRFYRDDWGVTSNTATVRFRYNLSPTRYLEPHLRLYGQSAADFHVASLGVDERFEPVRPEDGIASADYRLDAMRSTTLGLKYGMAINARTDFRLRAELLDQRFEVSDPDALRATILQASLRYRF